jgi:maltooligosyltrehalose trehalohydrolase
MTEKLKTAGLDPITNRCTFGPQLDATGCEFRLWARSDARIELVLHAGGAERRLPMPCGPDGIFRLHVPGAVAGARYWFTLNGQGPFPDPASRYQPEGVHAASQVVDAGSFDWSGDRAPALTRRELVIYELHVGTFTPSGTFAAAIEKLDALRDLGINAIEIMPLADFAGERNWGYDGVCLYAPAHGYGTPDDLRRLVVEAHRRGLAVLLDVVYNHLGPDGAYHSVFAPHFYSRRHKTPWGDGLNFDAEESSKVRNYFIESALMWVREYHMDGLRADATMAIQDESQPHFLAELTERVHAAAQVLGRRVFVIAEDDRNDRRLVLPVSQGGYGFDGVWADDFHHHVRHRLAGDSDGYFCDFDGTAANIARTIQDGWFFQGQRSKHKHQPRGTSPAGLPPDSRVFCIQNHDQIGNRAYGERLSSQIGMASYLAASALLLFSPEIPLLFMGQEWAAPEPFLYFTDHHVELGRLVTEGRRKEFEHFAAFAEEHKRETIPDPQSPDTFRRSKLDWGKRSASPHAGCLRWYQTLLQMRSWLLAAAEFESAHAVNAATVAVRWRSASGALAAVIALEAAEVQSQAWNHMQWILSSESEQFLPEPRPVTWDAHHSRLIFPRAGAVVLAAGDLMERKRAQKNE